MVHPEIPAILRTVFEKSQIPLTLSHARVADHPLAMVNAAFERMTGYTEAEVLGQNCRFLQGDNTEPAAKDIIRRAFRHETEAQTLITNYRKSGEEFDNFLFVFPIQGGDGRPLFYMASQFEVPTVERAPKVLDHAHNLRIGIEAVNEERLKAREMLINCGSLIGFSVMNLIEARLSLLV